MERNRGLLRKRGSHSAALRAPIGITHPSPGWQTYAMGSVIATKAELSAGISASPIRDAFRLPLRAVDSAETVKGLKQQVTLFHRLQEESAKLRDEMRAAQEALKASIQVVQENLARVSGDSQLSSRLPTFDPKRRVN